MGKIVKSHPKPTKMDENLGGTRSYFLMETSKLTFQMF